MKFTVVHADHLGTLVRAEERVFARILEHTDDHAREDPQGAFDNCHVADVEGIERPRKNCKRCVGFGHGGIVAPGLHQPTSPV
jgi:hypothetical protein